jgi:hypothetical protein
MVNLLLFLLLLVIPAPAEAQSFPKPPDVPAYVPITPTYASGTTLNVVGDGSATGGLPPATELAEVAPTTESGWTISHNNEQCLAGNDGPGGLCPEAKFRTRTSGDVKILYDDPIRNYGQPGQSHCHTFFGNQSANAYSTYATLRQNARKRSWAAGGPLNATAYWFPCVIKTNPFGDGKNYALRPSDSIIIYYTNPPQDSIQITRLMLGLRYVGAYDMDNGQTWLQSLVTTANAQSGTAGRYRVCQSSSPVNFWSANGGCHTIYSWRCVANDGSGEIWAEGFKNADNSDPFGGKCTAGQDLWVQFSGPSCWDGRNLWSPGGYKHVIPKIWDTVANKAVCPNGWYQIPELALQIHFAHQGFSDYGTWKLASDDAAGTLPGRSFHTDWFNGWDRTALSSWLINCIGIGNESGTPRECDGSNISNTQQLITSQAAPTGRTSQTATTNPGFTTSASGMVLLPSSSNGPKDIHVHGG